MLFIENYNFETIKEISFLFHNRSSYSIYEDYNYEKCIKLWNISSNPIINILKIKKNDHYLYNSCLMFKNEDIFIFAGENEHVSIWNKNGDHIKH